MADGPITLTLKGGAGFEVPWLVVSGKDGDELSSRLASVPGFNDDDFANVVNVIREANRLGAVKSALGAKETSEESYTTSERALGEELASATLLKVVAQKTGKTVEELGPMTKAQAQDAIKGVKK